MDSPDQLCPLGTDEFDEFVSGLDYPMFLVTTTAAGTRGGCMVGFTTQASIDPPRFLVCLSVQNHTSTVAERAQLLAVHVLESSQHELAELFGGTTGDEVDKFARCGWHPGPGGVPLLDDCPRRMVGRILQRHPFTDHVGYLLEPVAVEAAASGQGLTLQQTDDVSPGHPA